MASVRKDKVEVEVEINGKRAGQTLQELRNQTAQLSREIAHLSPGTEEFNKKAAELRAARARMAEVRQEVDGTSDGLSRMEKVGGKMKAAIVIAFAAVAASVVGFALKVKDIVVNAELVENKYRTVFGNAAGIVDDFARHNATKLGLTSNAFKQLASDTGDLLVPMGFTRQEAAEMSNESLKLAGALSQWSNGTRTTTEVNEILRKALLGERDGLKSLGISISEAEISTKLLERGQSKLTGTMLDQAKALATNELIMEKSKDAQNSFENGAGSLAQKLSVAKAQILQIAENLVAKLAPAVVDIVNWFGRLTGAYKGLGEQRYSEKLEAERVGVNALVRSITQQNEDNALRKKLIGELQAQYPAFLGNLDAEKVTNQQLSARLAEVNDEYRKKVLLATQDEIVKDVLEKQKTALQSMAGAQRTVNKGFMEMKQLGADVDLSAPLEKQFEQYKQFNEQFKNSGELLAKFPSSTEQQWAAAFAKIEGGITMLIGKTGEYEGSTRELAAETQNYDELVKNLAISMGDANALMNSGGDAAMDKAKKVAEAAEAEKKAADKAQKAREKALEDAKRAEEKFAQDMKTAAAAIQDLQIGLLEDPWEQKRAQLQLSTQRKIAALVGTPEQIKMQTALLNLELLKGLAEIRMAEDAEFDKLEEARAQKEQATLEKAMSQMQLSQRERELQLELEFSTRLDAESELETQLYEIRQQALNERLQLLAANGQLEGDLARQLEQEKLSNQIEFNKKSIAQEKKTAEMKKAVSENGIDWVNQAIDIGIEALGRDGEARKKNAAIAKAFTIGKIYVDVAQEIAGYMASPASVASAGSVGAILSALALARTAVAVAKVQNQQFERGSIIPGRSMGRFVAGIPEGPRHGHGGIRLTDGQTGRPIGEMEGGEPIMILSRNVYQNNRDVVDRLISSSLYQNGAPIFASGAVIAGPSGSTTSSPPQGQQGAAGSQALFEALLREVSGLRSDVASWQTVLKAVVSYSDLKEAEATDRRVRSDSRIG